jgi:hypothetical protein
VTHRDDSGRGPAGAHGGPRPPLRRARPAAGAPLEPAEAPFAAEVSRLPVRFGLRMEVDGFLAWRAYAAVRALWRAWRRLRRALPSR